MKAQNSKHLQIKDLISIGIYTALYYLTVAVSNVIILLIPGYSYVFIPALVALLAGSVYMLMALKVQKLGAITIMGFVIGLNFFVMGYYPPSLLISTVIAFAADLIAYFSHYRNRQGLLVSYVVFSYNTLGPILPMFLKPELYSQHLIGQGRDQAYIDQAFADISGNTLLILVILVFVFSLIGGLFAIRMMKKHFIKAGIV